MRLVEMVVVGVGGINWGEGVRWWTMERLITVLQKILKMLKLPWIFFFFVVIQYKFIKGKSLLHCIFCIQSSSNCQWSHTENQNTFKNSWWPIEESDISQIMITEAISITPSEMSTGDYGYSKETMVFQYALKFWGNYMSVLL